MTDTTKLRPVERRILAMQARGETPAQIADRLRWSPEHVERVIGWTEIPRSGRRSKYGRALEARVLALRQEGLDHDQIASRFRRSAENIRLIEALAHYRRAISVLRSGDEE